MRTFSVLLGLCGLLAAGPAHAFCGFYVGKADADLFNEASKVVLVRDDDRTVMTMVNDYEGDLTEFAMVIPTPTVLEESQIHIGRMADVDHLDAYTAPRLVEYFDENPCARREYRRSFAPIDTVLGEVQMSDGAAAPEEFGVTIEAEYTIGEYDILILSAEQSDGLQLWLDQEGYNVPPQARRVLGSYIAQDMKFFVAKVNLEEQAKLGGEFLRPIQIAYEHDRFMLPIRLGTVNARGPQDLILFTLTREGRVETTNYRTLRIPSNMDLPLFLKDDDAFADFYKAMFEEQVERENMRVVFTEYAWDMSWCDPCAADPLSAQQLRELGAFWIDPGASSGQARDAFVTRLHVRYTAETFPEDLMLQVTGDRENFQGRYVLRHPFRGDLDCRAGREYARSLPRRFEREAQQLASLTGWDVTDIRNRMNAAGQTPPVVRERNWWQRIWE